VDKRWCIYIDIEGFGALYAQDNAVLGALCDLMTGIYSIGANCYPKTPACIFAHQTGDGFAIVSEFGSESLERPAAIAVSLLRHVAACGRFAKASIGEGGFADITGCYPKHIRDALEQDSIVSMGTGLMTLFPVMGTAFINAWKQAKVSPSGALLTLAAENSVRLPRNCVVHPIDTLKLVSIDWVHSSLPLVSELQQKAGLQSPDSSMLKAKFRAYYCIPGIPEEWKANTNWYLSLGISLADA
jgi:hypothetical protein